MMDSGIYIIKNVANGKCYVGSTKNFEKRKTQHLTDLSCNKHCNIKLQRAFNKYGSDCFVFEVVQEFEYTKEIVALEDNWMLSLDSKKNGYNIADAMFGDVLTHHPNRKQIIKKISDGLKKTFENPEIRAKLGARGKKNGIYGTKRPQHVKDAISNATKNYVSQHGHGPTFGIKKSLAHKLKISEAAKKRVGNKNPFFGKKHSPETLLKISNKTKGLPAPNRREITVNGVQYCSIMAASQASGIKTTTLWFRANSKNTKFADIFWTAMPKTEATC